MNAVAIQDRKVLQLNKTWTPMHTISLEKALHMVFNNRARIVTPENYQAMTWSDWAQLEPIGDSIRGARASFRVPEIIVLNDYDKLPMPKKTFGRRALLRRDNYTCGYCGVIPGSEELTIDHVLPRSQGGATSWENCVSCCGACNARKSNRTPSEASMPLRLNPAAPTYKQMKAETIRVDSWEAFLGEMYYL